LKTPEELAEICVDWLYDAPHQLAGDPEYCIKRRMNSCYLAGYKTAQEHAHIALEEAEVRHQEYVDKAEANFKAMEEKIGVLQGQIDQKGQDKPLLMMDRVQYYILLNARSSVLPAVYLNISDFKQIYSELTELNQRIYASPTADGFHSILFNGCDIRLNIYANPMPNTLEEVKTWVSLPPEV